MGTSYSSQSIKEKKENPKENLKENKHNKLSNEIKIKNNNQENKIVNRNIIENNNNNLFAYTIKKTINNNENYISNNKNKIFYTESPNNKVNRNIIDKKYDFSINEIEMNKYNNNNYITMKNNEINNSDFLFESKDNFEKSQNDSLDITKEFKESNKTNIILSLVFPKAIIKELSDIYINKNPVVCKYNFKYKDHIINIYHIEIEEQKYNKKYQKEEIEPYFSRNHYFKKYTYICQINFIHYKNNFYYNLDWRRKEIFNPHFEFDIANSFDHTYLVHYYFLYLKEKKESLDIIKDLLNQEINRLNSNQNYNFNEYLSILIKSIQIKDSKTFRKCYILFNNQNKLKYIKIDKYKISKEDIKNYLLNEEEIKELKNDLNNNEGKNFIEKIKINIFLRNFKNGFEKIFNNLNDKNLIKNILNVIEIDTKFNQGLIIDSKIFYKLIDFANDKEQIKILLYNKYNNFMDFLNVIILKYNKISKLFSNAPIKVIDFIDHNQLNNNLNEFLEFLNYYSKILKLEKDSDFSFLDFNDVLLFYIENSEITHPKHFIYLLDLINEYNESTSILNNTKLSLYNIIHKCFVHSAMKGLINSYDILIILSEKDQYYFNVEFNSIENRPIEIFNYINIEEERSHFFEEFQRRKIWEKFNLFKEIFILYFSNQIKSIENFEIIFRLFPKEIIISFC